MLTPWETLFFLETRLKYCKDSLHNPDLKPFYRFMLKGRTIIFCLQWETKLYPGFSIWFSIILNITYLPIIIPGTPRSNGWKLKSVYTITGGCNWDYSICITTVTYKRWKTVQALVNIWQNRTEIERMEMLVGSTRVPKPGHKRLPKLMKNYSHIIISIENGEEIFLRNISFWHQWHCRTTCNCYESRKSS